LNASNDSLSQLIQTNQQNIINNSEELGTKIQDTEKKADSRIAALDSNVEKNRLYWIIATLATLLLGGLIYWLLGKRISSSKTDVETQIRNTKASLEEESVKLDSKLVEVLTKQLDVIKADQANNSLASGSNEHSLVLKVADRLTAMETNHYRMDPKTKGLKQLVRAVKSIKENYLSSGYEIVEMIGQEYKEGVNATVNFIQTEDIEKGKKVITKIIKPEVNFNGKMIQAAQIEVSVGE
jgi:plasmid maintenance system killer protein